MARYVYSSPWITHAVCIIGAIAAVAIRQRMASKHAVFLAFRKAQRSRIKAFERAFDPKQRWLVDNLGDKIVFVTDAAYAAHSLSDRVFLPSHDRQVNVFSNVWRHQRHRAIGNCSSLTVRFDEDLGALGRTC